MLDLGVHFERIARRLLGEPNKALSKGGELRFGTNGSLSVIISGPKQATWYDHENQRGGGVWEFLYIFGDMKRPEAEEWLAREFGLGKTGTTGRQNSGQHVVATYPYLDERGQVLFWVYRWGPKKTFTQAMPGSGKGGITRNPAGKPTMTGCRFVPYHLDQLAAAAGSGSLPWRVYIVEGEKDADRLRDQWTLLATCNAMGAGKWRSSYNQFFAKAGVVIIPDNDDAGQDHARQVAIQLIKVAASVRIVELWGLPEKGDVSDWIDGGATQWSSFLDSSHRRSPVFWTCPRTLSPVFRDSFRYIRLCTVEKQQKTLRTSIWHNFCSGNTAR
jgi:hypothetical protein